MPKFMQSLEGPVYQRLDKMAKDRGVSIQVLIRAVIIPEWFRENGNAEPQPPRNENATASTHITTTKTTIPQRSYSPVGRNHPLRNTDAE